MIFPLIKLMRLYYVIPLASGLIVIVSYVVGGEIYPVRNELILSFFSIFSVIAGGYVLNDVCDIDVDKINCPNRVLPKGETNPKTAVILSTILFGTGFIFGALCNLRFLFLIICITAVLIFYDVYSKRIGIFKDIIVAALMTSLYPLALTLTEPVPTPRLKSLFIFPVWLFLSSMGYEMLKDTRDFKGDLEIQEKGIANYSRRLWFRYASRVMILVGSLITLLPFFLGYCKQVYLLTSIMAIILAVLSTFNKPATAIKYIYAEIFLITAGSMADLLVFGP